MCMYEIKWKCVNDKKIVYFKDNLDPDPNSGELDRDHTIQKVKFLSKNSILTKLQHFHEFFNQIFFDNFSREIKVVNS